MQKLKSAKGKKLCGIFDVHITVQSLVKGRRVKELVRVVNKSFISRVGARIWMVKMIFDCNNEIPA